MPYNNIPIAPSSEVTGTVNLPLARTKKILHADPDLPTVNANAAFAITIAAEQFLQHLVEQTHNVARAERKPRRNIQYKDVANAVARHDNLEFLTDVVPRTTTYKAHREKVAREQRVGAAPAAGGAPNGVATGDGLVQSTLNGSRHGGAEVGTDAVVDHAGPEVMDIDAVTSPAPSQSFHGAVNGGHG